MARVLKDFIHIDGYTCDMLAFPFGISKNFFIFTGESDDCRRLPEWAIINRFSGEVFPVKFNSKKQAEKYFNVFCEIEDINNIEFKNPKSDFNYFYVSQQVSKIISQRKYMKEYYGY